jgi:hypothetical protein
MSRSNDLEVTRPNQHAASGNETRQLPAKNFCQLIRDREGACRVSDGVKERTNSLPTTMLCLVRTVQTLHSSGFDLPRI